MPLVVVVGQAVWVCTRDNDCLSGTAALCQVYFVRDFYFVSGTSISIVRDSCFLFRNSSLPT